MEGQLARWLEQLANFQYRIVHRAGKLHANADALSRLPVYSQEDLTNSSVALTQLAAGSVARVDIVRKEEPSVVTNQGEGDELAQAQMEDPDLKRLVELKKGTDGDQVELPQDPSLQKYSPVWAQLQVQGARLVRIPPANSDAASQVQVILPPTLVSGVLAQLHNSVTGGHLGIQKLQGKVKDRFYWPGWFRDVKKWCRECVDCASRKTQGKVPCAPLQISSTSRPYERVALDILGPLPETPNRNKYILVVGDYFQSGRRLIPSQIRKHKPLLRF